MPVYESICRKCGKTHDYYSTVEDRANTPICCGQKTEKICISPPTGYVTEIRYQSPIDGRPITTKQARIEDLKRNNARPWEGIQAEQAEANRRKSYEESRSDSKLFDSAARAFYSMPEKKRRELTRG